VSHDFNIVFKFLKPQALAVECLKWREIAKNEKNIYVLMK